MRRSASMLPDIDPARSRKPLNVAIVSSYRAVVPHYETELDIAQQHLDLGDKVTFLQCEGGLRNCEFNIDRDPAICENCRGRRAMGVSLLTSAVKQSVWSDEVDGLNGLKTKFDSLEELTAYRVDEFDLGYAALSSLVSFCRDPEPDLDQHADRLRDFVISAWQTYQQSLKFLVEGKFDRVYVYNGRFASMRSTLRACQKLNIDCFLHERGCDGEHFELLKNHLPHDLEKIELAIESGWDRASDNPDRQEIAESWFLERLNRVEKVWHSFTKGQEVDRLPPGWDAKVKNVSIFCSSDDEFVAIGDAWKNEIYPNQVDAIEKLVQDLLRIEPTTKVCLRMHPNLIGLSNDRCQRMKSMDYPNLTVVEPEGKVDTYRLVRDSDVVVSFGSSVGAEAVYWGTPSVLLGPCFYQNLGGVYRATSHEEAIELLTSELEPGDKTGVLKYGFWFQTRGFPHQYFRATSLFEGTFKGQTIYARPPAKPSRWKRFSAKVGKLLGRTS